MPDDDDDDDDRLGVVVQLARTSDCRSEGRGFETRLPRSLWEPAPKTRAVQVRSSPVARAKAAVRTAPSGSI